MARVRSSTFFVHYNLEKGGRRNRTTQRDRTGEMTQNQRETEDERVDDIETVRRKAKVRSEMP